MPNIQEEAKYIEKLRYAMQKIENDTTLSFHHWSNELNIPVSDLQKAWAKHAHEKRKASKE